MEKQEKVKKIYDFISENLYFNIPDIEIGDNYYNASLLFGVLTCLNKGKELIFGNYGFGKTTSAENIIGMMYCMPKEVVLEATVQGHPEQTEEKMVGRPDLGKLKEGTEKTVWAYSSLLETKIFDEINRMPESKQIITLQGIDRGIWKYMNEMILQGDFVLYATCNQKDNANTEINGAVLDRFDVAVESKDMGLHNRRGRRINNQIDILMDKEFSKKIFVILQDKEMEYEKKQLQIKKLRSEFMEVIRKRANQYFNENLELLMPQELDDIRNEINEVKINEDALLFMDIATSELSSCLKYGQKRIEQSCIDCRYYYSEDINSGYLCGKTKGQFSVRSDDSLIKYSKTLAWLNKEEVNKEHLIKILPYVMWHRTKFDEGYLNTQQMESRTDPLNLYISKKAVEELRQRAFEQENSVKELIALLKKGKFEEAKKFADEKDHPVFYEYIKMWDGESPFLNTSKKDAEQKNESKPDNRPS